MAESNIIQMHDYAGNNQYPVTLASLVYDEDGETVGKKLALLLDWFEWGDEKKTSVKTKYPFWSEKQLSAGGIGEEGEGGEGGIGTITGIKVNGEVWNEPDEFGVLTIPNYPTSLEWADIAGRPTHLSQFTDDVVAGKYLPLTGGTIESAGIPLTIKRTNNSYSVISFYGIVDGTSQHFGYLGFSGVDEPIYMTSGGSERILIHSGNVGEYAARSYNAVGVNNVMGNALGYSYATQDHGGIYPGGFISFGLSTYGCQLQGDIYGNGLVFRGYSPSGFTPWKTIAFTDSTVAAAQKLVTSAGADAVTIDDDKKISVRDRIYWHDKDWYTIGTKSENSNIPPFGFYKFYSGHIFETSDGEAMRINSSGNVLIGTTEEIGYKLDVRGSTHFDAYDGVSYVHIGPAAFGTKIQARGDGNTYFQSQRFDSTTAYYNIILQELGGNVGIGTSSPDEMLHVAGNIRLKNASNYGCYLKFGDKDYCYLYEDSDDHLTIYAEKGVLLSTNAGYGVTIDRTLTIGSAVLSWDSVNNALKIEGNVYTTGQLSAGGVGTEVQKVFNIAEENDAATANKPYTKTLTHNLNTYDLAVVVYEVTLQSDGITETLTQVLADVTLTDENKVTVYFASRKTGKKYRIVIVG